jgi:hypothetical protein
VDYAGAIYGSLLASSTIVATGASADATTTPGQLLAALVVTSTVFWLMHVYVRVVGRELPQHTPLGGAVRSSALKELPILVAVLPPSLAVLVGALVGQPDDQLGWGALWVALAGQVVWTWLALRQAHARRSVELVSLAVSLLLGLVLVGLKVALSH